MMNLKSYALALMLLLTGSVTSQVIELQPLNYDKQTFAVCNINQDLNIDLVKFIGDKLYYQIGGSNMSFGNELLLAEFSGTVANNVIPIIKENDFDGDGDDDLVVFAGFPRRLVVYKNNSGQFEIVKNLTYSPSIWDELVLLDLDNDGDDDLVYTDGIKLYSVENTNGFFGNPVIRAQGGQSIRGLQLMDMDFDDVPDLQFVMSSYPSLFIQNCANSLTHLFDITTASASSNYTYQYTFHDLDNDQIRDTLLWNSIYQDLSFMNHSTNQMDEICSMTNYFKVIDLDLDGTNELIIQDGPYLKVLNIDCNSGQVQLEDSINVSLNPFNVIQYKDVNFDGILDVITNSQFDIQVVYRNSANEFDHIELLMSRSESNSYDLKKIDSDLNADLFLHSSTGGGILKGLGGASFENIDVLPQPRYNVATQLFIDIDNDADLDLISGCDYYYSSQFDSIFLVYQLNDGNGNYSSPTPISYWESGRALYARDVNSDGNMDFIYRFHQNNGTDFIKYYVNTGSGNFVGTNKILMSDFNAFDFQDVNSDGKLDVIVYKNDTYPGTNLYLKYHLFNGTAIGTTATQFAAFPDCIIDYYLHGIVSADLDNDGDIDYLVNGTKIQNNNSGTYTLINLPGLTYVSFTLFDLNGDGLKDIFYTLASGYAYSLNLGSLNFAPVVSGSNSIFDQITFRNQDLIYGNNSNNALLCSSSRGVLYKVQNFEVGDQPILLNDTISLCSGVQGTIQVQNASQLNDNQTWALFEDSCSSNFPVQTSVAGTFTVSSVSDKSYFIKAIGNGMSNGLCTEVLLDINSATNTFSVAINTVASDTVSLDVTNSLGTAWDYSFDQITWQTLIESNGQIIIPVTPNTSIDLSVRPSGSVGACSNWPAEVIQVTIPCNTVESYDTIQSCKYSTAFYGMESYSLNDTPMSFDQYRLTSYGCDSIIHLYIDTFPTIEAFDTIYTCMYQTYTLQDGSQYVAYNNTSHYLTVQDSNGCYGSLNTYVVVNQPYYNSVTEQVCLNSSYTFPDGTVFNNIISDTSHTSVLTNQYGCDSTIQTFLNTSVANYNDYLTICHIDDLVLSDGTIIPNPGSDFTATHTYTNTMGCDSAIVNYQVTVVGDSTTNLFYFCAPQDFALQNGTIITNLSSDSTFIYDIFLNPSYPACPSTITDSVIIDVTPFQVSDLFSIPDNGVCDGILKGMLNGSLSYDLSIDGGPVSNFTSGNFVMNDLCGGIHDLLITDYCSNQQTIQFVTGEFPNNASFVNSFTGIQEIDSLGTTVLDCDVLFDQIDSIYISETIIDVDSLVVTWVVNFTNNSNLEVTVTYPFVNPSNGVYLLQLNLFCPSKSINDYYSATQAVYYLNGVIMNTNNLGLNEYAENTGIYPNPTTGLVYLKSTAPVDEAWVYDAFGRACFHTENSANSFDLSLFDPGMYTILVSSNGKLDQYKVVVTKR
jgi:uncharacterized protein YuzB (UPF0349 family)